MDANEKHKDSVFLRTKFLLLFGNPEVLRELYSAIGGMPVPPDMPVKINTLTNVLFKGKINDLSFLIDNRLVVIIEHQSTINENMPVRLLMYAGRLYEKIVSRKKTYQRKTIEIPMPEFIVLYNGREPYPEQAKLRLSDAFKGAEGLRAEGRALPMELEVQVYNINHGFNPEMLRKSETLDSYSFFISKVREFQNGGLSLDESVERAVKYCIENDVLRVFLEEHGSEVVNMLMTEWNWDEALEVSREEGREDEREVIARNALAEGFSLETVQKITGLSTEAIENL